MPPEQRDYGNSEPTLVPGTLTVFRHFMADLRSGVLTPMNYNPQWAARNGAPPAPGHRAYTRPVNNLTHGWLDSGPREREQPVYQAECNKLYQVTFDWVGYREHKSPDKDCTCGFYASYDPDTDFYPSFNWGRAYARLAGAGDFEDFAVVKAAVEVSGTVVMGRLGVRAEKMKILGIALDWAKQVKERANSWDRDPYFGGLGVQSQARYVVYDYTTGEYEMRQVDVKDDDDGDTIAKTHALANGYGATYHGSVDDLVKAYPKADVSALGIDEAPPVTESDSWGSWARKYANGGQLQPVITQQQMLYAQKAMRQASTSFNEVKRALQEVLGIDPVTGTVKPKERKRKPGGTMPDHARRALEAKQQRQAPPGSGIDRRKRKL